MSKQLFEPFQLGPTRLASRLVMAPMTRSRAGEGNVIQPMTVTYYRQRAGAGLIVTEATQVAPEGQGYIATPGIHSEAQVAGWRQVTDAVHEAGGKIFLQLWHVGRISHHSFQPGGAAPVAPSAIRADGETFTATGPQPFSEPRALATAEIPAVVEQFRKGAENAKAAGFDGVEIHGANGYLVDQFLRDGTNKRTDAYGGGPENRVRFALEVTDAVVSVWGADRVGFRISPTGAFNSMSDSDPATTFGHLSRELGMRKLAYLHIVEMPDGFDYDALAQAFGGVTMVNGGYDRARAEKALQERPVQLVSFGTLWLANPDLDRRLAANGPFNEPDKASFYGGDERGYIDYPGLAA
jgi:N-ethylmaleimide reductase